MGYEYAHYKNILRFNIGGILIKGFYVDCKNPLFFQKQVLILLPLFNIVVGGSVYTKSMIYFTPNVMFDVILFLSLLNGFLFFFIIGSLSFVITRIRYTDEEIELVFRSDKKKISNWKKVPRIEVTTTSSRDIKMKICITNENDYDVQHIMIIPSTISAEVLTLWQQNR